MSQLKCVLVLCLSVTLFVGVISARCKITCGSKPITSKDGSSKLEVDVNGNLTQKSISADEKVTERKTIINNCRNKKTGIYQMRLPNISGVMKVRCESRILKGGWLIIQRRVNGKVNFFRPWSEYKSGFGSLQTEFWLGLDVLHALTNAKRQEMLVYIVNVLDQIAYAKFSNFVIGNEARNYELDFLGEYEGAAGDSLLYHLGKPFVTYDHDSNNGSMENCAISYYGAWWYNNCYQSNLNGKYPQGDELTEPCEKCMNWNSFVKERALKTVMMMIRPSKQGNWQD